MNLYQIEYHCDLTNPKDTMDMSYFAEISVRQAETLIQSCLDIYGKVEDPTGLIFTKQYEELLNQISPCMVMYAEDVHENFCHQYLIVCAYEMPEAEDIGDVESWNHILNLVDDEVVLVEPEDEPMIEETDGADDAN